MIKHKQTALHAIYNTRTTNHGSRVASGILHTVETLTENPSSAPTDCYNFKWQHMSLVYSSKRKSVTRFADVFNVAEIV